MSVFLAQLVFVARNNDFEGWAQILVIVIIAVVFGLGNIIRAAKARRLEAEESGDQQSGQARSAGFVLRSITTTENGAVACRAYKAESKPQRSKAVWPEQEMSHKGEELPKLIIEVDGLEHKGNHVVVSAKIAEATYPGKPLLDVRDPQAIKKAVRHYETMGKPLSL